MDDTKKESVPTPIQEPTTSTETTNGIDELWQIAHAHAHDEIWGVQLADPKTHVPSQIVFQKFINAYDGDLTQAKDKLKRTLDWRQENKPLDLLKKPHSASKFDGLGYVTSYGSALPGESDGREVFTWNIYGGVKDIRATFGDLKEFISWRVAVMEQALAELDLNSAKEPITPEHDPWKIYQAHDYKGISFFRQSAEVKTASTETIKVLADNYPELLKEKFFVNVPAIMGFVYTFMKLFVAAKTIKKFHPMANSMNMVHEFGSSKVSDLGKQLPPDYGGEGKGLKEVGKQVNLA
ncbi:Phosphatidylinositol transfer protein SFH5 [Cyphellophora attinorum]|uniref:Phosphatidylinositol transfer protein SFH5 n=1 Tax=Cyphellophora attinorum TaxID=1664694 RepID=A0A0N0NNM0_9EURO|nr:Phosphatidylinositol transfer protein SFH5 [Phialophora attinorum]KPI41761.1 Phosphatidylinositol transfer protein SFH5 [Phialophora attinorum]